LTEGGHRGIRKRPSSLKLYGLIGVMVAFWSANFVVAKIALRDFHPLLLSGLRTALAALFILPVVTWSLRRRPLRAEFRGDLAFLLALGVFGLALNQVLFTFGLNRTSVGHSSILLGMTPVLVLLMAALSGQEPLRRRKLIGMGVALSGVALLNLAPGKFAGANLLGDILIVMASLTFSWFTVFGKRVTIRHGAVVVNAVAYVGAALMLAPLTVYLAWDGLGRVSAAGWLSLLYMALFPSMVCYLIYAYALEHIPASRVSLFSYVQPVLATSLAIPVLGERLGVGLVAGGALVFTGVWLAERG
jgi:drug/metabolite transporter (DMT)-like permease